MSNEMLNRALVLAFNAHQGQVREFSGDPYIVHPICVASLVGTVDAKVVALLHDVVEDTPITLEKLREDFPDYIVDAVDSVTKRPGEGYSHRTLRTKSNPLGRMVKIADISDNLRGLPSADPRHAKYARALQTLMYDP